jgi:acetolactate synthase-1/2/3 large subunit
LSDSRSWDVIVKGLSKEKIGHVFGLPGNPNALYDSLYDSPEIKAVLVRHEASAAFMATTYAKLTRRPGVCFGSPGPGVANMVSGVLEAHSGCNPLLVLGSSVSTSIEGKGAFQETPQIEMFRPITKWQFRLLSADRASWALRRGLSIACNGKPGPVYIDVPFDVGVSPTNQTTYACIDAPIRFRPDKERVKKAGELLCSSERPVIVAGGGAQASGCTSELISLSELLGIPILTTPCGRGVIPESHPLSLGLVGLYRTRLGKKVYQNADLLISLGSRNEEFQTAAWEYYPNDAKFIQVDIDASEIGRNWVPDVALVGDIKLVLEDLLHYVTKIVSKRSIKDLPRVKSIADAKKIFFAEIESECLDKSKPLKTKRIIHEANKIFGSGTVLVNENGSQDLWSYYYP